MKRIILSAIAAVLCAVATFGQSYSISQNQQTINLNVPVIEKPVYIEKYRTVYVDKPQPKRVARTLTAPVQLYGYLWVYTEDIGNFKNQSDAAEIIRSINSMKPYGRDNWRIPTDAELAVLEKNADKIGLGDDIYLSAGHANGVLRMVSTNNTAASDKFVDLGLSVKWAKCNMGASTPEGYGNYYTWDDACAMKGINGRCPTKEEFNELRFNCKWTWTSQNGVNGYKVTGPNGNSIFLPAAGYRNGSSSYNVGSYGDYWSSTANDNSSIAYSLRFNSGNYDWDNNLRYSGRSVRPVTE